jgi:phage-related protein
LLLRTIRFYETETGNTPVVDFLESLSIKENAKVTWTLNLVETLPVIPKQYMKKLVGSSDIWEVRILYSGNIFRILCFFDGDDLIVLNHAFRKKTQKTPRKDIKVAEQRKRDYLRRKLT